MYQRILVVVEDGHASNAAIAEGIALARVHSAEVLFCHVLPTYHAPVIEMPPVPLMSPDRFEQEARRKGSALLAAATEAAAAAGVRSSQFVLTGPDAVECISSAATQRQCSLIVVASTGWNAVMRLLTGSVIPGLITRACVPVLVCRYAETANTAQRQDNLNHQAGL